MNRFLLKLLIMLSIITFFSISAMTINKNKYYHIKSVLSGDENRGFWDLPGNTGYKKRAVLQLWSFDKGDDRKYMITPAGNGWNYISPKNASFGRLFRGNVDVSDSRVRNGSKVHIWNVKLRKNANQQFKFKHMGGGKYKIYINQGGGKKILCAANDSDKNGTRVVPWDDNNRPACLWRFIEAGNAGILYSTGASVVNNVEVTGGWDRYIYAWGENDIPDTERWTAIRTHFKKNSTDMGNFWDIPGDGHLTKGAGKKLQLWEMKYKFQKNPDIDRKYKFLPLWERTGRIEDFGYYIIQCSTGYYINYKPARLQTRKVLGKEVTLKAPAYIETNKSSDINTDPGYHWKIDNTGKNRFTFTTRVDGSFLSAAGKASENGAALTTSQNQTRNSQWEFIIISKYEEKKSTEELIKKRKDEINKKVNNFSAEVKKKGYKFTVKATEVINKSIKEITGAFDIEPDPSSAVYMKDDKAPSSLPASISRNADMNAFNWRDINMMSSVKNQKSCGSCWAFSAAAVYEGVYKIMYGKEIDIAEQYIVDCLEGETGAGVKADCGSCSGGNTPYTFRTMISHGIPLESIVPYKAQNSYCSKKNAGNMPYKVKQYGFISTGRPGVKQIKEALCKYGPLFSSTKVTPLFQAYGGGVYDENVPVSGPRDTSHAMVIVGWDDSRNAWLVKNSWGESWGENGYVWIEYGCANIGSNVAWIRL